ncbi:MAG TPA: T9SS type A sorting domain-containing protein [Crocinitomicaceae bacterium]|nr:T9SS type A sorting domain-containing protein [Crocinitomicaceae bacterium]
MKTPVIFIIFVFVTVSAFGQQVTEDKKTSLSDVQVLTNATTEILFLKNSEAIGSYRIIDMNGQVVQTGFGNTQIITILDLESGFYLLELKNEDEIRNITVRKR